MKAFLKEFLNRLKRPTVYTPIIAFLITVMVASGVIKIGESDVANLTELIVEVIGAILAIFGVANNPTDKKNF
jgi:uncharacterized membrane protein